MAGTGVGSLLFPRRRAEWHVAEIGTHTLGQMGADIAAGDAAGRAEIKSRVNTALGNQVVQERGLGSRGRRG
jgi:hypothetical protein